MVGHGHHLDLLLKALLFSHRGEDLLQPGTFFKAPPPLALDFSPPRRATPERPREEEKKERREQTSYGGNARDSRPDGTFSPSSSSARGGGGGGGGGGSLFSGGFAAGVRGYLHMGSSSSHACLPKSHTNTAASSHSHAHQHQPMMEEKKICASCAPPSSLQAYYQTDLVFLLNNTGVVSLRLTVDRAFVRGGPVSSGTSQWRSRFSTTSFGASSSSSSSSAAAAAPHAFVEYVREKRSAALEW